MRFKNSKMIRTIDNLIVLYANETKSKDFRLDETDKALKFMKELEDEE